jgi:hypothetical protein
MGQPDRNENLNRLLGILNDVVGSLDHEADIDSESCLPDYNDAIRHINISRQYIRRITSHEHFEIEEF